jgi:hypothetical protein
MAKVTAFQCDNCRKVCGTRKGFRFAGDVYPFGVGVPVIKGQIDLCAECTDQLVGNPEHKYALAGIADLLGLGKGASPDVIVEAVSDLQSSLDYHESRPYPDDPAGEIY